MVKDKNFNELAGRFRRNIYGTDKGVIRLEVLWRHLIDQLPYIEGGEPLRILDIGCGMGVFAEKLARLGHELVLCDISDELLDEAKQLISGQAPQAKVSYHHMSLAEVVESDFKHFDLVLCHAVLEWLADPKESIPQLKSLVKPGGHLSLMFYNVHSLIFRNLVRGNLRKVKSGSYAGDANSLTPQNPLDPQDVYRWLDEAGIRGVDKAGVRVYYDYMEKRLRDNLPIEAIVEMELEYSRIEPYLSLGRYIHVIGEC